MVLMSSKDADLSTLLIVLLPSATTSGREAKLESSNTNWLTFLAASEPLAIAMEQSAHFKAKTSLTPSPVIATVCPWLCKALISIFFCSGVTRPKTSYFSTASKTFSSVIVLASTPLTSFKPALLAIDATV